MNFFDSLIKEAEEIICPYSKKLYAYDEEKVWADAGENQVILTRDTAFQLDGVGFNLVTTEEVEDSVVVVGDDLGEITGDRGFARVSVASVEDTDDEQSAYNLIKKVDYVKYHFFPDGYMMRSTSRQHKESVRVSNDAVKKGVSFEGIGNLYIKKCKENPKVKGVQVFFITDKSIDIKLFEALAEKNHKIAEALNHIMNNIMFDCDTCNLKAVCDEVEGMKELHFRRSKDE